MREIEYRAWSDKRQEWVYGTLATYGYVGKSPIHVIVPSYASDLYGIEINPETIEQYTGLKDKNGQKIFEGDILRADVYWDIRIEFKIGSFMCCAADKVQYVNGTIDIPITSFGVLKLYEVIGNIHENPELLEV